MDTSRPQHTRSNGRTPPGLSLRRANADDIAAVISVDIAASALFAPTGLLSLEALGDHVEATDLEQSINDGGLDVAELGESGLVGFVQYRPIGDDIYLSQLSVDPAFGQRGIGRRLVEHLEARTVCFGVTRIVLSTFRHLAWNGPFYESAGFAEIPRSQLLSYMLEIEDAQRPFMDVSKRMFMAKTIRQS